MARAVIPTGITEGEAAGAVTTTVSGYRSPPPHRHSSGSPVKPYRESDAGHVPHQGQREMARRRRQMARAKLKAEAK